MFKAGGIMEINDNLNNLIDGIKQSLSNDLFLSPIIIFDNLNVEQWFKMNWLKNDEEIYMNIPDLLLRC